ncbi:MnhB domain-containing protein [Natronospora cellulosivora (SeqCode)]
MTFKDEIVNTITRFLLPFITLFGIYLIVHVHLSPGGGFSGGTVIGSAFVLFSLSYGVSVQEKKLSHRTSALLESFGGLWYIFLGMIALFLGQNFLANSGVFPLGRVGSLFSSGMIILVNIGLGLKVASTFITLFDSLSGEDLE